jgi:hypothetical protein
MKKVAPYVPNLDQVKVHGKGISISMLPHPEE